jgi:hypothetical protein
MTEQEKAINEVLNSIVETIAKWQNKKIAQRSDTCCAVERDRGFREGLRLSGALVRARLITDPIETEEE